MHDHAINMQSGGFNLKPPKPKNKSPYASHILRVRNESDLEDKIQSHIAEGNSLNWLVTELLCDYFKTSIPHKCRFITIREKIWPPDE